MTIHASNTADLVTTTVDWLSRKGFRSLLFGGWAEEALGLREPGPHKDIDLLLLAPDFRDLERLLACAEIDEVTAKRFVHKRAFLQDGVLVELLLVQQSRDGPVTSFWGDVAFEWFEPLAQTCELAGRQIECASIANLLHYRRQHQITQPWRWRSEQHARVQTHTPT